MNNPFRVQLKRTAGWKMPPNTKSVTRPGPFGNPFKVTPDGNIMAMEVGSAEQAVEAFEDWLANHPIGQQRAMEAKERLRGFNLGCWCPLLDANGKPAPCHANTLLRISNEQ